MAQLSDDIRRSVNFATRTCAPARGNEKDQASFCTSFGRYGEQRVMIRSGKTIYVRFDRDDYSIPPQAVGRTLTVLASPTAVRLLREHHAAASTPLL